MSASSSVRQFQPSDWKTYKDLRLRALADSPDAFGSTLAIELERSDAQWAESLVVASKSGSDFPLITYVGHEPAGLAWAKVDSMDSFTTHLFQMWVAPERRGQGIGGLLLNTAIQWAKDQGAKSMVLSVTCGNTSAVRLYQSAGFRQVGVHQPLRPGSLTLAQRMALEFHQ